jgi:Mlc titration factor MtfA (ptsG expression regulator)
MLDWLLQRLRLKAAVPAIPEPLWQATLARYPFVRKAAGEEINLLRSLAERFLAQKEFSGAQGFEITDEVAVAIATQACLPVLHLGLHWYEDFTGIVVHPGAMRARRESVDAAGVVHAYTEDLTGEAMDSGPVTLSWADVSGTDAEGPSTEAGYNVVIHEFVHKLDMRSGPADGCPPLHSPALRARWPQVMQQSYDQFREQVSMAERFGGPAPWLDSYGATAPAEFFSVASEAFFMNPERLAQDFPEMTALLVAFFRKESIRA